MQVKLKTFLDNIGITDPRGIAERRERETPSP
jgi:hypothetical protein